MTSQGRLIATEGEGKPGREGGKGLEGRGRERKGMKGSRESSGMEENLMRKGIR